MDKDDFSIRILDISDLDEYIKLFNSKPTLLNYIKTLEFSKLMIEKFTDDFKEKQRIIVGAFYNNKLVCSISGYFPDNIQYWYAHRHFSNFDQKDLGNYKLSMIVWSKCMYVLMDHGEKNGYYSFYSRRSAKQQQAFDKVWKKFVEQDIIENKYHCFYEAVYSVGEPCRSPLHKFFFPEHRKAFETETIISMFALKQDYRVKLLNL